MTELQSTEPSDTICSVCEYSVCICATCECCPVIGVLTKYMGIMMCADCMIKENNLQAELVRTADSRVENARNIHSLNDFLTRSREIDDSIQIRSDIFNAHTTAIVELKASIDSDNSIENKNYALAFELDRRFKHLKQVIFEENEKQVNRINEQKSIQTYLNNLANKLRVEEREKLKLTDITYKPTESKPVVKRISTKKIDKTVLRAKAIECGVPESVLQMIVVSKNMTIEQASEHLKKAMSGK